MQRLMFFIFLSKKFSAGKEIVVAEKIEFLNSIKIEVLLPFTGSSKVLGSISNLTSAQGTTQNTLYIT